MILKVIKKKFNIGFNKLAKIMIENNIMFLNLIIFEKLLGISMLIIPISHDFDQTKKNNKIKQLKVEKHLFKKLYI